LILTDSSDTFTRCLVSPFQAHLSLLEITTSFPVCPSLRPLFVLRTYDRDLSVLCHSPSRTSSARIDMAFFSTASTQPEPKPSDKVVPLHFFDDGPLWRAFVLYSMFVFDCSLDVEKLHTSLERLAHREGWWKLGARLRKDVRTIHILAAGIVSTDHHVQKNGNLEYHIPEAFTSDRPAITYSHIHYDVDASSHPLASRLPKASARPSIVGDPDDFHDLMWPAGAPMKLNDYINSDRPQLSLHIVTFRDTTLVTLCWPHTLMDAMGKKALLDAWCLMLEGRDDEVKAPYGVDTDPLITLGTAPTEPHKLVSQQMGIFGLVGYGLGQAMDFIRKQENRMVCVPSSFVQKLQDEALAELAAARSEDALAPKPFLSEGDVLCAWWTRLAVSHLPPTSTQTVVLNNALDIRKRLQDDLVPEGAPYVSNAIGFINVLLSVKDITEKPLSYVASSIRAAITDLGTREQIEAFFAMVRASSGKLPPFFGDKNMHMITYSNWTKANLFDVDFSSAIIGSGGSNVAKPRYIQNNQVGLILPNGFPIIGKDNDGNYWLSGYMNKWHWENIEAILVKEG
jgi:hypothetical protein